MSGIDSDLIRGHIDTIILKTLFDGDKYGYEILDEVSKKSGGAYELKQPTLYSCLKRLENQGLISSYWVDSEIGGKRHYYCLTDLGKENFIENQKDWLRSRQIIDNLIWEDPTHLPDRNILTQRPEQTNEATTSSEENTAPEAQSEATENLNATPQSEITENTETIASTEEVQTIEQPETETSESITTSDDTDASDIMQLLGHFDYAQTSTTTDTVEDHVEKLESANEELVEENHTNIFLENFAKNYLNHVEEDTTLTSPEPNEQDAELPEVTDDFDVDMDDFLKSESSFFDSRESKDKTDFITPSVITDGYEPEFEPVTFLDDEPQNNDDEIITSFDEIFERTDKEESTTNFQTTNFEETTTESEPDPTPTYYSFGEEISRPQYEEDTALAQIDDDTPYQESYEMNDYDTLYSQSYDTTETNNTAAAYFENNIIETTNTCDTDEAELLTTPFLEQTENTTDDATPSVQNFYTSSQQYESIAPKYTDEVNKKKLNELTTFAKQSTVVEDSPTVIEHEKLFDTRSFIERNKETKNYDKLITDFESEGLEVRVHTKLVKESKDSRTYVQTNKIKMTRNWISFCFITALLAIVYAVMEPDGANMYDFSYKYFLIGILVALVIPITSTIIYASNPYKKHVAQYSPGVSLMLSVLIFMQLLTIIYCVNLQLGFFSFTQQYYNHLFWIIPMIISIYPLLNSVVYMTLYNSKNFHV